MRPPFIWQYILDAQGQPVPAPDTLSWGRWYEEACRNGTRRVALDKIGDLRISTVFLALDHSLPSLAPPEERHHPVLWETCIFDYSHMTEAFGRKMAESDVVARYASKEDALAGHRALVAEHELRLGAQGRAAHGDGRRARRARTRDVARTFADRRAETSMIWPSRSTSA